MAFMGRESMPSIENNNLENNGSNNLNRYGFHRQPWFFRRAYYYIPLDNTYVIMQIIVTFIILIVGVIAFLTTYKSTIVDPIEGTKKLFINIHLIILGIFLTITLIVNLFSKSKESLLKRLLIVSGLSVVIMLIFCGIKLNLDVTYTESKFEQFYLERNTDESSSEKNRIDLGITGVSVKTEKEYYIDECMKLYNIFKIKSYGTLGLHMLLNILLIYQIIRVQDIQNKRKKIDKDDLILFDEEQNVKF